MITLAPLIFKMKGIGISSAIGKIGAMQSKWGALQKKMGPGLEKISAGWKKLGIIGGGALFKLIQASPRLRAEFELLNIRINQLIRPFGDALAPIIRTVTELIKDLTIWFKELPEPIKDAINFATQIIGVLGAFITILGLVSVAMSPLILGILAIGAVLAAFKLAWETNWLGIKDFIVSIIKTIAPIIEWFIELLGGIAAWLAGFGPDVENILKGVGEAFAAFFGGVAFAFEAFVKLLGRFGETILEGIGKIPKTLGKIPAAIVSIFGGFVGTLDKWIVQPILAIPGIIAGIGQALYDAGVSIFTFFLDGLSWAIENAGGFLKDLLQLIFDFFGGSLPERGPLVNIPHAGQELGRAYVENIGEGLRAGGMNQTVSRNFTIEGITMNVEGGTLDSARSFMGAVDNGIRRSTGW